MGNKNKREARTDTQTQTNKTHRHTQTLSKILLQKIRLLLYKENSINWGTGVGKSKPWVGESTILE